MMRKYHTTIIDLGAVCGLFLAFAFSFDQNTPVDKVIASAAFLTTAAILGIVCSILLIEKRIKAIEFRDGKIADLIDKFEENREILTELRQQQKPNLTQSDKIR